MKGNSEAVSDNTAKHDNQATGYNLCWRSGDLLLAASAAATLTPSADDAWWSTKSALAVGGVRPRPAGQPYGA